MESYFITEYRIYNTLDSDSIVLEKCNFVHEKSLKSPWILLLKKCGNHETKFGSQNFGYQIW